MAPKADLSTHETTRDHIKGKVSKVLVKAAAVERSLEMARQDIDDAHVRFQECDSLHKEAVLEAKSLRRSSRSAGASFDADFEASDIDRHSSSSAGGSAAPWRRW